MDENAVLVTLQYRLGMFGFLTTNDETIPGNMGLKDAVMALRWVKENIAYFGGDPNQVMIMGESAGATMVQHLMLSPLAQGLFHRAISLSGSSLFDTYPWSRNHTEHVEYMGKFFKCPTKSTKEFAKCMRSIPMPKLMSLKVTAQDIDYLHHPGYFIPVVEPDLPGAFLKELPIKILQEGRVASKVPWMTGFNENEGIFIVGKVLQFPNVHDLLTNMTLWDKLISKMLFYEPELRPDAAKKIWDHYFGDNSTTRDVQSKEAISKLSSIISEKLFFKTGLEAAMLQSQVAPVYMYYLDYYAFLSTFPFLRWARNDGSIIKKFTQIGWQFSTDFYKRFSPRMSKAYRHPGTAHGDELFLLFNLVSLTDIFTSVYEKEMSRLFVKAVVDFAHVEKPVQFNNLDWPRIKPNQTAKFMNFNVGEPKLLDNPVAEKLKFWNELDLPTP